ncbi:MAG: hypothetical protein U0M13_09315 [Desulfovibrio fairfieldensis]|nr:hypothetical protein [Desulfovibrio fairfieldensis]
MVNEETFLFGSDRQQFLEDLEKRRSGSFLCFFEGRLTFTAFTNVADSSWMLIHR